jgi:hypothetical protein
MTEKKPHETLREKIKKRDQKTLILAGVPGKLSDSEKKTPSQKKSESLKRKLDKRKSNR